MKRKLLIAAAFLAGILIFFYVIAKIGWLM